MAVTSRNSTFASMGRAWEWRSTSKPRQFAAVCHVVRIKPIPAAIDIRAHSLTNAIVIADPTDCHAPVRK